MAANRPPQRRKHTLAYKDFTFFYNDDEITLEAKYYSRNNKDVDKIDFKLTNTKKGHYSICGIVEGRFQRNGDSWYESNDANNYTTTRFSHKMIIHLTLSTKKNHTVSYTPKKTFKLSKGKEIIGLFWVHDVCPEDLETDFPDGTPETKDGTIVEGI